MVPAAIAATAVVLQRPGHHESGRNHTVTEGQLEREIDDGFFCLFYSFAT